MDSHSKDSVLKMKHISKLLLHLWATSPSHTKI